MDEIDDHATSEASRHIIERPRLTRLLDESTARVIMLVAPAGYGKTTLARQWLANRPHAWYSARASSNDIAALGIELLHAAESVTSEHSNRFAQWTYARHGSEDPAHAAGLLSDDLKDWPVGAWFAIDDYHRLTPDAEHLISRVRNISSLRLLLTTRRRPLWFASRDLLYGEIFELDSAALVMSDEEAAIVLADVEEDVAKHVIALAEGWPAIIGLASHAEAKFLRDRNALPPELHGYIAEELYSSIAPSLREELAQLSLLPTPSSAVATALLGPRGSAVVAEGVRVGFLIDERSGVLSVHPLLRAFLRRKLLELPSGSRVMLVEGAVRLLLADKQWVDAYDVAKHFDVPTLIDEIIELSLYDLLTNGRLSTLSAFVELGRLRGADGALLDLAEAEVAFREGFHERARRLAERAAGWLDGRSPMASKAFCRAGHSAYFTDAIDEATSHFQRARQLAQDRDDEHRAVWGLFLSALEHEDDSAAALLDDFERISDSSPDDMARIQNGRLHFSMRLGTLRQGLSGADAVARIVSKAKDPVVRASFWHIYGAALRLAADYGPAMEATERALSEIARFDLNFGRAHVYLTRAAALAGVAAYDEALALLDEVARDANRNGDNYLQMNERTTRCKVYLLTGAPTDAMRVTDVAWPQVGSRSLRAEFLALRAMALATLADSEAAMELIEQAEQTSRENEATTLCTCAQALLGLDDQSGSAAIVHRIEDAIGRGIFDPLVLSLRLDRQLARFVARQPTLRSGLREVLQLVDGSGAADGYTPRPTHALSGTKLTPREQEVLELVTEGRTNKEIGRLLFLSESTVKVHVRHVLRKLGVRTRTQAAIYALRRQPPEALEDRELQELDPE